MDACQEENKVIPLGMEREKGKAEPCLPPLFSQSTASTVGMAHACCMEWQVKKLQSCQKAKRAKCCCCWSLFSKIDSRDALFISEPPPPHEKMREETGRHG